jgi:acetyl esterase/lipase
MASGQRSRSTRLTLVVTVLVAGCAAAGTEPTTLSSPSSTTTVTATTPTTSPPITTSTMPTIPAEVLVPDGDGPFPAVVLAHGGGWVSGTPSTFRRMASYLTEAGFLTINAAYKLSNQSPGFPTAVEDIACAVRYAASHPDSDGTVTLVGYSAGAHISALVALTGNQYTGSCPFPGSGVPDRFVGLAGIYDVRPLGILLSPFFGQRIEVAAELWSRGNPQEQAAANPSLRALILHGELDTLIDVRFADSFHQALGEAGVAASLEVVTGARHTDMADPDFVGDLVVSWLNGQ